MAAPRQLAEKNQFEIQTIAAPRHLDSKRCVLFLNASSSQALMDLSAPAHRTS